MSDDPFHDAAAAARWMLDLGQDGMPLTQTFALARSVVREAALRHPDWCDAELHGPPHREADVRVLSELHEGLKRTGLMRRRGRTLRTTQSRRALAADPVRLLRTLLEDLGGGDAFTEMVAGEVRDMLIRGESCSWEDLTEAALRDAVRRGWRTAAGELTERYVSYVVGDVLARGEAYGLVMRIDDPGQSRLWRRLALTPAARALLTARTAGSTGVGVFVFDAVLANVRGVSACVAVGEGQHLTQLHNAIQEAFGWLDDHLYSFWLDGRFWGDAESEYTSPVVPDEAPQTADVPLAELDLATGQRIAYVFDFGDEWRVNLTLRDRDDGDGGGYPRVLSRTGKAPPQYG